MNRGDLTNSQWERLQPLLPPQKPTTGRPAHAHRTIINGIVWILRTGAPWRDLPERFGPWRTVASRFYRWQWAGIWSQLLAAVHAQADAAGQLTWDLYRGHHPPSPPTRGWGNKRAPETEALGRSRGGFSTKVHLRAEGGGQLMTLVLRPGQRHEAKVFEPLLKTGAVKRRGPGRPKRRPHRIVGDKGYSSRHIREYARQHGIRITIPHAQNEGHKGPFHRALYRLRNRIERLINRCKQFRRLATRYEKRAKNYHAMWLIGATILWLDVANTP